RRPRRRPTSSRRSPRPYAASYDLRPKKDVTGSPAAPPRTSDRKSMSFRRRLLEQRVRELERDRGAVVGRGTTVMSVAAVVRRRLTVPVYLVARRDVRPVQLPAERFHVLAPVALARDLL